MNRNGPACRSRPIFRRVLSATLALMALLAVSGPMAVAHAAGTPPPGLIEVYIEALQKNADYRAQVAGVRSVEALERVAKGQLLPQLGLGASYDLLDEAVEGDYYQVENIDFEDRYERGLVGLKLTQPLYQPGLWISRDQAELRLNQSRFELEKAGDQLLLEVVTAYFGVLGAQDALRFAQAEAAAVDRQLEQIRSRGEAGLVLEAEVLAASAQRSITQANLIQAQGQVDTAMSALDLVSGLRLRELRVLPEGMVIERPQPADPVAWVERARDQNLDVVQARISAQLAQLDADKARASRWPTLDAVGSATYLDLSGGVSGERTEEDARIGLHMSMPLYSGGSISAGIGAADAVVERSQALVESAQARAERDARVAYFALQNSFNAVPARHEAVRAARAAEDATFAGFEAGTRTNADVLRAVEARYDAERAYSGARYDYMLDSLRLRYAAGTLVNGDLARFDRILRDAPATP